MSQIRPVGLVAIQSDRVEELVDRLVLELARERDRRSDEPALRPFLRHSVVVPSRNLAAYLRFEVAARLGVVAGVDFVTIEQFLEDLLPIDDDGELKIRLLSQTAVTRQVLSLLDSPLLFERSELEPVRQFVIPTDDPQPEVVERRKFQFAFRLARLFEEYGYSRQKILRHWRKGESGLAAEYAEEAAPAHLEIEKWQMAIWRELFGPQGAARSPGDDDGRPWMILPQAIYHYMADAGGELRWPESVHIFGHSYFPRFFRALFSTRTHAEDGHIALYVMNPCLEHWSHGIAGDRDEDPVFDLLTEDSILGGDEYPLALAIWGRAGRDYQRMIDEVAYDREDISLRHRRPTHTLLQHFQAMIREMTTASEVFVDTELPEDRKSINFWSCASVQRECEAIASEIWELVTTHEELRFNEIAVVVQPGERALYQTHLEAAFEQTGGIPANVIDVEQAQSSAFLEAVRLLLELPLGRFRRRELLALLVHPCLVANYPEADEEAWLKWCDGVNIFQGADSEELKETYLSEDRFTWSQGMRRLVLGAFMSRPEGGTVRPVRLGAQRYLPYETQHQDLEGIAELVGAAGDLIDGARRDRRARRALWEWMEYFADQIERYLSARDVQERRTKMRFVAELSRVAEADICGDEEVGYRTAYDFAMAAMANLEKTRGHYLADGVVVSAFRPMRPIPFKVVFVAGLGEGKFPAPDPPDMLDLRRVKSETHDVNPRYQDQYMFLETLVTTRCRLYLSWVGRHAITGESVEPASVVHQLREMILEMAPRKAGEEAEKKRRILEERVKFREHPLRRFDERYFPQFFEDDPQPEVIDAGGPDAIAPQAKKLREDGDEPVEKRWPNHHREAREEARVWAIRKKLHRALPQGYRPTMEELRSCLDQGVFAAIGELVQWSSPKARDSTPKVAKRGEQTVVLQLHQLRRFLQCPLQGAARVVLGLYDEDDEDVLDAEHEPFEADFLTRLAVVRRVLESCLRAGDLSQKHLEATFDEVVRAAEMAGELPAGIFFEAEREKCARLLGNYASALEEEIDVERGLRAIRFGAALSGDGHDEIVDPLQLDVEAGGKMFHVELHGTVQLLGDGQRSLVVAAGKKAKARYGVQAGVDQIVLRASEIGAGGEVAIVTSAAKVERLRVSDQSREEARDYLERLVGELLSGVHDYFLPVELVQDLVCGKADDYLRVAEEKKKPAYGRSTADVSTAYGPVRRWQDIDPPPRKEAHRIIEDRYGPFMDMLIDT